MTRFLSDRSVLAFSGRDRLSFLQGLVTNDVTTIAPGRAIWSALLTPQGRWLSEFFLFAEPSGPQGNDPPDTTACGRVLMDCPRPHAEMLIQRLSRFRLRADVQITHTTGRVMTGPGAPPALPPEGPATSLSTNLTSPGLTSPGFISPGFASPDSGSSSTISSGSVPSSLIVAPDPRCDQAGWRGLALTGTEHTPDRSSENPDGEDDHAYRSRRIALGLPDWTDLELEKTLALEANMDLLNGVSFTKGCYMGQELTARTHYRAPVRRRLLPLVTSAPTHQPSFTTGEAILLDGKDIGHLRSCEGNHALAFVRREAWHSDALTVKGIPVRVLWPAWFPPEKRESTPPQQGQKA